MAPINLADLKSRIAGLNHADRLRLAAELLAELPGLGECIAAIVVHELRTEREAQASQKGKA